MYFLFLAIAIFGPIIRLAIKKQFKSRKIVIETFLLYWLFVMVGLISMYAFIGHAFFSNRVAEFIGWPTGNPFQLEIAVANLAFGILGFLCIWFRGNFWTATIFGYSIFLLGAAVVHIRDIFINHNLAPGNAGIVLYLDILVPIVLLCLWFAHRGYNKKNMQ